MDYTVTEQGMTRTDIPIHRIEWSDGRWWDVLGMMPHKVQAAIRLSLASVASVRSKDGELDASMDDSLPGSDFAKAAEEARMARMVGCTVAWAWEESVSKSMIDDMPPFRTRDVLDVLADLHQADVMGVTKEEKKRSPSPSLSASLSGANGSQPSSI